MTSGTRFARNAVRVAVVTTIAAAVVILVLCAAVDLVVAHTLRSSAGTRLTTELHQLTSVEGGPVLNEPDLDDPFLVWRLNASGSVITSSAGAPSLPAAARHATTPAEMSIGGSDVLVAGAAFDNGRLIGAVSLAGESSSVTTLLVSEAIIGPILLAVVFGGAVVVGRNAAGPIERARRRQLEFTADASHELRTPLAVIEAETSLALSGARDGEADTATLQRVAAETTRMRTVVEDLLWLARLDAMPPEPMSEPVDVATVVELGARRFASTAERAGLRLENVSDPSASLLIDAPAEWIDRLVGVLLDNACRYTPSGGHVRIAAARERNHLRLAVTDDGPGISPERRERIFDRFHRGTSQGDGAGLGLAIANAIVGATHGRWQIEDVTGGGVSIGVAWAVSRSRLVDSDDGDGGSRALGDSASRVPH
jgi:two-component system, OmpR family, sensor histidine kinase CiaH